jgi:hypothetical protein
MFKHQPLAAMDQWRLRITVNSPLRMRWQTFCHHGNRLFPVGGDHVGQGGEDCSRSNAVRIQPIIDGFFPRFENVAQGQLARALVFGA